MTIFKRGDFVMSNDQKSIGIVVEGNDGANDTEQDYCRVFWSDGDYTTAENYTSMNKVEIKPEYWTALLLKEYMDIICP